KYRGPLEVSSNSGGDAPTILWGGVQWITSGVAHQVIAFIPVSRDKIVEALNEGRGDVAVANLTITPEREAVVEFSDPVIRNVAEILVTSPDAPPVGTKEELSGKEMFVRPSSSYFQSLTALNQELVSAGKAPLAIHDAPEDLQDEDILEMLQASLVKYTI